ncbi:NDR1/HIN1-like protein 1 [Nymphaea colorata]|nr:NDR1/HIN1-like protein 1 [Nymphaea colorata]
MTKADCGQHDDEKKKLYRRIIWVVLIFLGLVLLTILIIYLVLLPSKPSFVLQDASVVQMKATGPGLITSAIQATIVAHNPNNRIGIFYDRIETNVAYLNQQITPSVMLPQTYQSPDESCVWTPLICGTDVPAAPYVIASIQQAPNYASGSFSVRIAGKLRWQVGSWTSSHYGFYVQCDAYLPLSGGRGPHNFLPSYPCRTDVWSQP